jgi:hypothetical protein
MTWAALRQTGASMQRRRHRKNRVTGAIDSSASPRRRTANGGPGGRGHHQCHGGDPTLRMVADVAGVVLIRAFLRVSLEVEIEGKWPRRRTEPAVGNAPPQPGSACILDACRKRTTRPQSPQRAHSASAVVSHPSSFAWGHEGQEASTRMSDWRCPSCAPRRMERRRRSLNSVSGLTRIVIPD